MLKQLGAISAPPAVLAALGLAAYFTLPGAWFWIWPALVAVLFLALGITAFILRWKWFVPPFLAGFVGQAFGIIWLAMRPLEQRAWLTLLFCGGALGICLLVMLVLWVIAMIKARLIQAGVIGGKIPGIDEREADEIRKDLLQALKRLEKAKGRGAIYYLPWTLVIGRPAVGKTKAIHESGFRLLSSDRAKGIGGTRTANWFVTPEMIFLDTPGRWTQEVMDQSDRAYWDYLLKLLKRYRPARPLDGIAVVISADDLLLKGQKDLRDQAARIREVYDLLHDELQFRFPVYVLVSKCDLIEGFVEFFEKIPPQRRQEILGWSNDETNIRSAASVVEKAFRRVVRRLEAYRLEFLARGGFVRKLRRLFMFPDEFRRLEEGLVTMAEVLFEDDGERQPPVFRGVYFTSSTQGEGAPLANALGDFARSLGVRLPAEEDTGDRPEPKGHFLRDLFGEIIAGDEGLVGRTAKHWWSRRKNTTLAIWLPAAVTASIVLVSSLILLWNRSLYARVEQELPAAMSRIQSLGDATIGTRVQRALVETALLRELHDDMTAWFSPRSWFFMRQPGKLAADTFSAYRSAFNDHVLAPTLNEAGMFTKRGPVEKCPERIGVLHSIVWLRLGKRIQENNELSSLATSIWQLQGDQAERVANDVLQQFGHIVHNANEKSGLLLAFPLDEIAAAIRQECASAASGSALSALRSLLKDPKCIEADAAAIRACYTGLNNDVLLRNEKDFGRVSDQLENMTNDLNELATREEQADNAKRILDEIDLPDPGSGDCIKKFSKEFKAEIRKLIDVDAELRQCQSAVDANPDGATETAFSMAEGVVQSREEQWKKLAQRFTEFNTTCGEGGALNAESLKKLTKRYFVVACRRIGLPSAETATPESFVKVPQASKPVVAGIKTPREPAADASPPRPPTPAAKYVRAGTSEPPPATAWSKKLNAAQSDYQAMTSDPQMQQTQLRQIRADLAKFEQDFRSSWVTYLGSLRLVQPDSEPTVETWLENLGGSSELRGILSRAGQALAAGNTYQGTPPFNDAGSTLKSDELEQFVNNDLGRYFSLLRKIASDIKKSGTDPNYLEKYQQQLKDREAGNALVEANDIVQTGAGGILGGVLVRVLRPPLDAAREAILVNNPFPGRWRELVGAYARIKDMFPFAGNPGRQPVPVDELVKVFGRASGLVKRVDSGAAGQSLSAESRQWLTRAVQISDLLFEAGSDRPRSIKIQLQCTARLDPPKASDDVRFEVIVDVGDTPLKFKTGDSGTQAAPFFLFGEDATTSAAVRVSPEQNKAKVMGTKWEKIDDIILRAITDQTWAPVALFKGPLSFEPAQLPKKAKALVELKIAKTDDLRELSRLMDEGLPEPPPRPE